MQTTCKQTPSYFLDESTRPLLPLFYAMLNKSLALPLLEDWVDYLWVAGRERRWVQTLGDGRGQDYARWRALPSPEDWQPVQEGLVRGKTTFKGNTDQPV